MKRVTEVTGKEVLQPVATTMKTDKSVKTALAARALNIELVKDKHQMPKVEQLVKMVAKQFDNQEERSSLYMSLDMRKYH